MIREPARYRSREDLQPRKVPRAAKLFLFAFLLGIAILVGILLTSYWRSGGGYR